jgi:hypothetical protein
MMPRICAADEDPRCLLEHLRQAVALAASDADPDFAAGSLGRKCLNEIYHQVYTDRRSSPLNRRTLRKVTGTEARPSRPCVATPRSAHWVEEQQLQRAGTERRLQRTFAGVPGGKECPQRRRRGVRRHYERLHGWVAHRIGGYIRISKRRGLRRLCQGHPPWTLSDQSSCPAGQPAPAAGPSVLIAKSTPSTNRRHSPHEKLHSSRTTSEPQAFRRRPRCRDNVKIAAQAVRFSPEHRNGRSSTHQHASHRGRRGVMHAAMLQR